LNSNFKPEEIVEFERYNKKLKKNVVTSFPIVGGRLRLFHEDLSKADNSRVAGGIDIEIIDRDREYALVKAKVCIDGNAFTGIGMSSKSRDGMIYPAIMEMAETRAIARALRFAGYGVEYTGAEEMQGLKKFDDDSKESASEPSSPPSDVNTSQAVNDDSPKSEETPNGTGEPSLKRQVWDLVTNLYPSVQENYLADAVKKFVEATVAKYDDGNADTVYNVILANQTRFANAFSKYVDAAIPDIKSADTDRDEKKQEFLDATSAPIEPSGSPIEDPPTENVDTTMHPDDQKEYNESRKEAADTMKIDPPPPAVDPNKVAKANIYRAMPDGINVAALNGTLTHLITENHEYKASEIYDMVIKDIDGFMVMLKNWCKNNDVPSGLEPKTEAPAKPKLELKEEPKVLDKAMLDVTGKEFRKAWVRLDLENFTKFILQNCDTFKSDKEEYDLAVAKFDRLKEKSEDTKDLVFPFLFKATDAVQDKPKPELSTENSVLEVDENGAKEISIMKKYLPMFPVLSKRISETMGIDLETETGAEAMKFNEKIEELLTKYENEHQTAYVESYEGGDE
jgi:hypothetical protein